MSSSSRVHRHVCQRAIDAFVASVDGVHTAVIASPDGFVVASASSQGGSGERLAAITSSMLALAGAIGRELALGQLQSLIIEASQGKVVMLSLQLRDGPLLLMASCGQQSVLGTVLWRARQCAQEIIDTQATAFG